MIAITQAAEVRQSWRLDGCTLYVTLEPCPMRRGGHPPSPPPRRRLRRDAFQCGAVEMLYHLLSDPRLNHRTEVVAGVSADPCGRILSEFFRRNDGWAKSRSTSPLESPGRGDRPARRP